MKNNVEKKLVLTDLDGTLLNNSEDVSPLTIKVIKKIISMGHIVCIATGRPLRSSLHIYKKLGLNTVIANLNGSILTNPTDETFLPINLTFNKNIINEILNDEIIYKHIGCALIENMDGAYLLSSEFDPFIANEFLKKFHINKEDHVIRISLNELKRINRDINSILIYIKDKTKIDELSFKVKSITTTLIVRNWSLPHDDDGIVLEINSIFSNKGTILKFLSSYYAIPLHNCFTFGDGENDLEMIRTGINGYAMRNGSNILKLISTKITKDDNNNDGVAKELMRIFKITNKSLEK